MKRKIIDVDVRKLIGINIYLLIMLALALLKFFGCRDLGNVDSLPFVLDLSLLVKYNYELYRL